MIVGNNLTGNGGLAIDLLHKGALGVTPNDPLDADDGPNGLQNFPVLTQVTYGAGATTLHGQLHAEPSRLYFIDLYTTVACHASGHGGATRYLGFVSATTDAAGHAAFSRSFAEVLDAGFATATATRGPEIVGPTSEFSPCLSLADLIFANGFQP